MRFVNYTVALAAFLTIFFIAPSAVEARTIVDYKGISKGSIVINTSERRLYLGLGKNKAVRYKVGVGRADKQWSGKRRITGKRLKPAWSPTAEILRDNPNMPRVYPSGSPRNPMGAAVLLLSGKGQYAIHGTNKPKSVGGFVSYGCIRMYNEDIKHLYSRVRWGTKVIVLK
jgi:lipoprotein-anchoring transpeptidase ErfK/SrfK